MFSFGIIRSYLMTTLRVVVKDPLNSSITIAGLALSLAAALLITLQIWDETHVDAKVPNAERVYRIEGVVTLPGRSAQPRVVSPTPLRDVLTRFDQVEQVEYLWRQWSTFSRDDDPTLFFNHPVNGVTEGWFDLFPVKLIEGDAEAVLRDPSQLLLSETLRDRLFPGGGSVLGRTLQLDGKRFTVAAVMEDLPHDTHLDLHLITSVTSAHIRLRDDIDTSYELRVHSYARLRSSADRATVEQRLNSWAKQNLPPTDIGAEAYDTADLVDFHLRPVRDIHLQTALPYRTVGVALQMKEPANASSLYTLGTIAVVILVLGSINYINLSSARAMARTREVAMRKVVGASRSQVMVQFLGESALYALIAAGLALAMVEMALPILNPFIGKPLTLATFLDPTLAIAGVALVIVTALLAGLYPAFYLSAVRPRRIWGSISSAGGRTFDLRKALVLGQFAASITLLVCTIVMQAQAHYARNLDLGFNPENVVVLYGTRRGPANTIRIHDRL
ncbi:MAG: ABC transporter permease, partial [Pseudomonadota bacterium]